MKAVLVSVVVCCVVCSLPTSSNAEQGKTFEDQPFCSLQHDGGPCMGHFKKWYYDKLSGECKTFIYGGCPGNENRFDTKEFCEKTCKMNKQQQNSQGSEQSNIGKDSKDFLRNPDSSISQPPSDNGMTNVEVGDRQKNAATSEESIDIQAQKTDKGQKLVQPITKTKEKVKITNQLENENGVLDKQSDSGTQKESKSLGSGENVLRQVNLPSKKKEAIKSVHSSDQHVQEFDIMKSKKMRKPAAQKIKQSFKKKESKLQTSNDNESSLDFAEENIKFKNQAPRHDNFDHKKKFKGLTKKDMPSQDSDNNGRKVKGSERKNELKGSKLQSSNDNESSKNSAKENIKSKNQAPTGNNNFQQGENNGRKYKESKQKYELTGEVGISNTEHHKVENLTENGGKNNALVNQFGQENKTRKSQRPNGENFDQEQKLEKQAKKDGPSQNSNNNGRKSKKSKWKNKLTANVRISNIEHQKVDNLTENGGKNNASVNQFGQENKTRKSQRPKVLKPARLLNNKKNKTAQTQPIPNTGKTTAQVKPFHTKKNNSLSQVVDQSATNNKTKKHAAKKEEAQNSTTSIPTSNEKSVPQGEGLDGKRLAIKSSTTTIPTSVKATIVPTTSGKKIESAGGAKRPNDNSKTTALQTTKKEISKQKTKTSKDGENGDNISENDVYASSNMNQIPSHSDRSGNGLILGRRRVRPIGDEEVHTSSHFAAFFLSSIVAVFAVYFIYHNRQKIVAIVIEGRSANPRRSTGYKKLETNVEEAMPTMKKYVA